MGRSSKSFFISNYFQSGLLTRETNTDIKPMFNRFKAVTYMRAYFSKTKGQESTKVWQKNCKLQANKVDCRCLHFKKGKAVFNKLLMTLYQKFVGQYILMTRNLLGNIFSWFMIPCPVIHYWICFYENERKKLSEECRDIFKKNITRDTNTGSHVHSIKPDIQLVIESVMQSFTVLPFKKKCK